MKRALAPALTLLLGVSASAQFRTDTEIVRVDVAVSRRSVHVPGLSAGDFVLLDNGIRQNVTSVVIEDHLPLEVALVLDTSGSVSGSRLSNLIAAGNAVLADLKKGDKVALITFSQSVRSTGGWTSDFAAVARELAALRGNGQTALRDAAELGLALPRTPDIRELMVVFSDGVDNVSWLTDEEVVDSAKRADVVVHAVRVPNDSLVPPTFLEQLTKATGGKTWQAGSDRDLQQLFRQTLEEMRSRYLLTYSPQGVNEHGWHELRVTLRSGRADILARPGYFSGR